MSNSLTLTRRNCGQYIEKNMELPQNCRSISAETFFNRPRSGKKVKGNTA